MGGGVEEEYQTPMVPCLDPIPDPRCHETASLPILDGILAEILLRLPTPADLVRASVACVSFRHAAAHRSFIRRYQKLHALPLLGFLELSKSFYAATSPYPSASAASAVAFAADFSFSFIPADARDWCLQDIRDSRVLLDRHHKTIVFPELVVCNPLHRRYLLLPPITDDLAALAEYPILTKNRCFHIGVFLVPTGEGEEADGTSFRVTLMPKCESCLLVFVFSSHTGQWRALPSRRWTDLSAGLPPLTKNSLSYSRHYLYGFFYWLTVDCEGAKLLVLDTKTMEFSIVEPPPEAHSCNSAMVEAGLGCLCYHLMDLTSLISLGNTMVGALASGSRSIQSQLVLGPICYVIWTSTCSCISLKAHCWRQAVSPWTSIPYSLRRCMCDIWSSFYKLQAYSNFSPSLSSSPTISSGVGKGAEKDMQEQGSAPSSSTNSAPQE